jgi:hypothetical protein
MTPPPMARYIRLRGAVDPRGAEADAAGAPGWPRVIHVPDCHFRKTATEYDGKLGIKWLSGTAK